MPKYTANTYLVHSGAILATGEEVELTAEQAERLGDKVKKAAIRSEKSDESKATAKSKKAEA